MKLSLLQASLAVFLFSAAPSVAQGPTSPDRVHVDGQTLDPGIAAMLAKEIADAPNAPKEDAETPQGRAEIRRGQVAQWSKGTAVPPAMRSVSNDVVRAGGVSIPVRIYHPAAGGPLPIIVYYHGGGWFIGGIDASDRSSRQLAADARAIVVSVDYRLSPEAAYPDAWDDAENAFEWTVRQAAHIGGAPDQVCVGGDSAGGNMAIAVTTRRMKNGQPAPLCQLLYYPAVDNRAVDVMRATYASSRLFGEGYHLDRAFTDYILPIVFPREDLAQPEISPLLDASRQMPPTLIATAGFDPLRDSQRAYAAKLAQAGTIVSYQEFHSLIHGFLQHSAVSPEAARASQETAVAAGEMARNAIAARVGSADRPSAAK